MQTIFKLTCSNCNKHFKRNAQNYSPKAKNHFCSKKCQDDYGKKSIELKCKQCSKKILKRPCELNHKGRKTKNAFCSRSCAATYNNTHKKHGTRRSKLEKYLEEELTKLYPNLEIHFNRKDAINSELDIYIPSLSLAFELNGIFHYEPIYGKDKLASIQNNDKRKFQACLEKSIELCIIDASSLNNFKPKKAEKYLDIIVNIINQKTT